MWLLSRGADPNGDTVMYTAAHAGSPEILQLLIDAGGDVNQDSNGWPVLFAAMAGTAYDHARCVLNVQVLLDQPVLDLDIALHGTQSAEQYARALSRGSLLPPMIVREVRTCGTGCDRMRRGSVV